MHAIWVELQAPNTTSPTEIIAQSRQLTLFLDTILSTSSEGEWLLFLPAWQQRTGTHVALVTLINAHTSIPADPQTFLEHSLHGTGCSEGVPFPSLAPHATYPYPPCWVLNLYPITRIVKLNFNGLRHEYLMFAIFWPWVMHWNPCL